MCTFESAISLLPSSKLNCLTNGYIRQSKFLSKPKLDAMITLIPIMIKYARISHTHFWNVPSGKLGNVDGDATLHIETKRYDIVDVKIMEPYGNPTSVIGILFLLALIMTTQTHIGLEIQVQLM